MTKLSVSRNLPDVLGLPIWYNMEISNTNLFCPNWYNKGVALVGDLFGSNGKLLTENEIKLSYGIKTNFLEYHRVITCVKVFCNSRKGVSKTHTKPIFPQYIQVLMRSKKGCKDFYNIINSNKNENQTSYYSYWEHKLKQEISSNEWKNIYRICFKTIEDNELIWFQYRLINRISGTSEYLTKIKIKNNANCVFCNEASETISHLFTECDAVKIFWSQLNRNIKFNMGIDFTLSPSEVLFGITSNISNRYTINFLYLIAKTFIFKTARSNGIISYESFRDFLKKIYLEQEYVSKLKFKHTSFIRRWGNISHLIS